MCIRDRAMVMMMIHDDVDTSTGPWQVSVEWKLEYCFNMANNWWWWWWWWWLFAVWSLAAPMLQQRFGNMGKHLGKLQVDKFDTCDTVYHDITDTLGEATGGCRFCTIAQSHIWKRCHLIFLRRMCFTTILSLHAVAVACNSRKLKETHFQTFFSSGEAGARTRRRTQPLIEIFLIFNFSQVCFNF